MKKIVLMAIVFLVLIASAIAIPSPHAISGFIYDEETGQEVPEGTSFSVENLNNGFYIEGKTGRYIHSGKYAVSLDGEDGDQIIIRAWNDYHSTERIITLEGVMENVNLLLNMSLPPLPPEITSQPLKKAIVNLRYSYQVKAQDPNNDILYYYLLEKPDFLSINEETGLITGIPRIEDVGEHLVKIEVNDGYFSDFQEHILNVVAKNNEEEEIKQEDGIDLLLDNKNKIEKDVKISLADNIKIKKLKLPFEISGVFINKKGEVINDKVEFTIENIDTKQRKEISTENTPIKGQYAVLLTGNVGDRIKVGINNQEIEYKLDKEVIKLNFIKDGEKFLPYTNNFEKFLRLIQANLVLVVLMSVPLFVFLFIRKRVK